MSTVAGFIKLTGGIPQTASPLIHVSHQLKIIISPFSFMKPATSFLFPEGKSDCPISTILWASLK